MHFFQKIFGFAMYFAMFFLNSYIQIIFDWDLKVQCIEFSYI